MQPVFQAWFFTAVYLQSPYFYSLFPAPFPVSYFRVLFFDKKTALDKGFDLSFPQKFCILGYMVYFIKEEIV